MTAAALAELEVLRGRWAKLLGWQGPPSAPATELLARRHRDGYLEQLIRYPNAESHGVRAFLLVPECEGPFPGVVVHHQHNSEWHLGKSEVAGRHGDRWQALGPMLARRGVLVLAPDTIGFEDRRRSGGGTGRRGDDSQSHYLEMAYRLVQGSLLMSLVVADAALAVSVLTAVQALDRRALGVIGHSMGGHITLFSVPLDPRVQFACASGAASGYQARMAAGIPIEVAQLIPNVLSVSDFDGLVRLIAPRPLLLLSATEDRYSADAPATVARATEAYRQLGARNRLTHLRFAGGHPLTGQRVERMLTWVDATTARLRQLPAAT